MKLAVLVSGTGTILEAMISSGLEIRLVVADRSCRGLDIAQQAGLAIELVERTSFGRDFDRTEYSQRVVDVMRKHQIDFIAMAGFMTVFNEPMFASYDGRILNTHPSLLPAFKGAHAVRDALAYGVKVTGCTIHVATLELDAGPIMAQAAVSVESSDTEESLHERIKTVERQLYTQTVGSIIKGELRLPS